MDQFTQFDSSLERLWQQAIQTEDAAWPFFSYSWHRKWFEHFGADERLAVYADRDRHVVIPLAVRDGIAHFSGGEEIADYLDAIGPNPAQPDAWKHAIDGVTSSGARTILLRNIPEGSPTVDFFRNYPNAVIQQEDTTPILMLPDAMDAYFSSLSRKNRHEFRRKQKRFEEQFPDASFTIAETLDIELLLTLMHKNPDKTTFLAPEMERFFRELPKIAGSSMQQCILTVSGINAATTVMFRVGSTLLLYNSGYDPEILGSGWYLKSRIIEHSIRAQYTSLNFLQGNERYKYDLGAVDFPVYRIEAALG